MDDHKRMPILVYATIGAVSGFLAAEAASLAKVGGSLHLGLLLVLAIVFTQIGIRTMRQFWMN
ncbi:hypothetical protein WGT02_28565 (plasmid) [Rhizobium sp. T1470]|uniref:hypothetical protein n=1 Tax=unclassified Rhizobium TaxID=2613769 RepID=UPI001AAFABC4|nr:hypothetical protein [Rhizobium sp. T1473]MCA0805134.1 hypothetical protein [Rhizobium sp. T1473]